MTSSKVFPSDEQLQFMLCDDVRQEKDAKFTVVGMIPGRYVQFNKMPDLPADAQLTGDLTLLFVFNDGVGEFKSKIYITSPSKNELVGGKEVTVVKEKPDGALSMIVALRPLAAEAGEYKVTVQLDEKQYHRSFVAILNTNVEQAR